MEYPNITLTFELYMELFNAYKELNQIKNLIEDNIMLNTNNKMEIKNNFSFVEDLFKLIKYSDIKFYDDLIKYAENKQQGKA